MIEIKDLKKIYEEGKENQCIALESVNICIEKGDCIAIVGTSGSGKTTFLNILGLMENCSSGSYFYNDTDMLKLNSKQKASYRNSLFGYVVQDFALVESYTVKQNLEIPLDYSKRKINKNEISQKVDEVLEKVALLEKRNTLVRNLSWGQRQRVAIARAIINNPEIILADEPTGALDEENTKCIIDLLMSLNEDGKTVIIITHDMKVASSCDKVLYMCNGILSSQITEKI